MSDAAFEVVQDLTPALGSELRVDREALLSGRVAADIRRLLDERLVLSFRAIGLSPEEQVRFASTLGPIGNQDRGGILQVSQNPDVNPDAEVADYQRASLTWHFDGFYGGIPDYATMLNARVLPETGGETHVANAVMAFADLPADEQEYLETLWVVHDVESAMRSVYPWPTHAQLQTWQKSGQRLFPLVWRTKSGRKSLLLGHSASHVRGMSLPAGRTLLCRLCEWVTQPRYVYTHSWQMGDLLLWDNAGSLHKASPYPETSRRLMDRTALLGDNGWEGRSSYFFTAEDDASV
ncbi:TauD/TfdA family dioxygenase [Novosphingobium sp. PS1R-30]|uniref:TauD/TfdA family dioxygenase n=1 Tax=Novosphingobium anseongense TaxID=3133436 RepID=A0ABU8S0K6_9SPHN